MSQQSFQSVLDSISRKSTVSYTALHVEGVLKDNGFDSSAPDFKARLFFCLIFLKYIRWQIHRLPLPLLNGTKSEYFGDRVYLTGVEALAIGRSLESFTNEKISGVILDQNFTLSQFLRANYDFDRIKDSLQVSDPESTMRDQFMNNTEIPLTMAKRLAKEFHNQNVPAQLMRDKGLTLVELSNAGYSATDLKGTSPSVTIKDLQHLPVEDLASAFSSEEMTNHYGDHNWISELTDQQLFSSGHNTLALRYKQYMAKFYYQRGRECVCGGINNSGMQGIMPMPQKFDPSDGGNSFAAGRQKWVQNVPNNFGYDSVALKNTYNSQPNVLRAGKPLPRNDASSVIQMRRISALGKGTANPIGYTKVNPLSFSTSDSSNINTTRQARRRTRSSGYVVPPKVYRAQQCGQ